MEGSRGWRWVLSGDDGLLKLRCVPRRRQDVTLFSSAHVQVCQKTGEISLLKKQLRVFKADVALTLNEIVTLRSTQTVTDG